MKSQTKKRTNLIVASMLVVAALAAAFWMVLLSPKREEAAKLSGQIESLETSLAQHRSEVASAAAARRAFPQEYARLVALGKAVPSGDETASLLVQLSHLARKAGASFETLTFDGGSEETAGAEGIPPASATEAEDSLLPLGAVTGPAGLAMMPYSLTFEGNFFQVASFVEGLDALVETSSRGVVVKGRLITIGSFSLSPAGSGEESTSRLMASFSVTTYLTPPGESLTVGATAAGPEELTTLTSATTGTEP